MALIVIVGVVFALPALLIGWLARRGAIHTWDYRERWSGIWAFALAFGVIYALIVWLAHPLPFLLDTILRTLHDHVWQRAGYGVAGLWLLNLLLFPMFALILEGLHPCTQRVHVRPRHLLSSIMDASTTSNQDMVTNNKEQTASPEPLGTYLGGDLHSWVRAGDLLYPLGELRRHGVLIGEPGFGKTETILRLAVIAASYGWQIIFIDLKGSYRTAARFVASMQQAGMSAIKTFPAMPYDGWRGDARALYNRLMAMLDPNTHPYYRQVTSSVVSLALGAPTGPPRNSIQFLARLDKDWLKRAYYGRVEARVVYKLSTKDLAGVFHTYNGFFRAANGGLDGHFAFEDADAAYMVLDGTSLGQEAATIGRYLLEDCAHFAVYRKQAVRQTLIIVDEFGALRTKAATDLFERVREFTTTVFVTAQSYEGLGPDVESILGSAGVKILHRCGNPEKLVAYAGTREEPMFDYAFDKEGVTGSGKMRMHRGYRVQPDDVRQLPVGRCCLTTGGLEAWVQVYPLSLPADLVKAAETLVRPKSSVSPHAPSQASEKQTSQPPAAPSTALNTPQTKSQVVKQANGSQQHKTVQNQEPDGSAASVKQSQQLLPDTKRTATPAAQKQDEPENLPPLTDFFG